MTAFPIKLTLDFPNVSGILIENEQGRCSVMCYLIAKDVDKHGCYALKTTHGEHLVALKRMLNKVVGEKGVQLVTISRPSAYGEYAPYMFIEREQDFIRVVTAMK